MSKKLVVVCGSTGGQGGAVIRALLASGKYSIRGLTRDTSKPAAQALTAQGVEMVVGDPMDRESLIKAFQGAYAVFGVTIPAFFPGQMSELEQGKNLVDACKADNVPLFVWSSLPSVKETSNGKSLGVTAFDDKNEVDKYIESVNQPAVIFKTGGFISNTVKFGQIRTDPTDPSKWNLYYPWVRGDAPLYTTHVEKDLGPSVVAAIDNWDDPAIRAELEKDWIPLVSFAMSGNEKAKIISEITGKKVDYVCEEPTEGRNAHPILKNMYQWSAEQLVVYPGGVPPPLLIKLGVEFHGFEDYVKEVVVPFMNKQA